VGVGWSERKRKKTAGLDSGPFEEKGGGQARLVGRKIGKRRLASGIQNWGCDWSLHIEFLDLYK
jgi:hypothetical protein